MRISFFEEYPAEDSLSKLKMVPFKTDIYIASRNVVSFLRLSKRIKGEFRNVGQVVYWPVLDLSEGYWISAFSKKEAIKRITRELQGTKENFPVLWDAEVPTLNKMLFITQIFNLVSTRKLIQGAIKNGIGNHPVIVAELPRHGIKCLLANLAGVSFPFTSYHRLDMLYTSLLKVKNKTTYIQGTIRESQNRHKKYSVGLGLIGRGVEDSITPLIPPEQLERDLRITQHEGVEEVVLYRLGGLNQTYLTVIKKYAEP